MIFIGDIASPDTGTTQNLDRFFEKNEAIFKGKRLICNFEGMVSQGKLLHNNKPLLFNDPSVPGILNRGVPPVLCLANNHTLDLPSEFDSTIEIFNKEGITFCGAGRSKKTSLAPILFCEGNRKIMLFNACWDFLLYNHRNPSKGIYVAKMNETGLISEIRKQREANGSSIIIVFLHWSLDLEILPYPMYRQLSMDMIDVGANLIIGTHSHCVQGGEKYKNGYIVYGLGNFFMPENVFISGKLVYPEFAKIQLTLEWDPQTNEAICHWFKYQINGFGHDLIYLGSEKFEESEKLKYYSPFQRLSAGEYLTYFKKHRRKRLLIPVYSDYKRKYSNMIFTHVLKNRARIAHFLARLNIIRWEN